jgi:serine/threonine-protein phosphatase 2A regulatory subunit B''
VHASARRRANVDTIPTFYFPGQRSRRQGRIEEDQLTNRLPEIETFFKQHVNGIPVDKFVYVTKRLCNIPSFFNIPLCSRILSGYGNEKDNSFNRKDPKYLSMQKIKLKPFLQFWQKEIEPYDHYERFFRIVKQPDADYITKDDFVPFLQELLRFHPGLFFLEHHEEFQRKYALTVITRIFYKVNKSRTGKISLREIRNSNLVTEFMHVDEETDINRVVEYFSYEHFYVLYCKFFELDSDKDSKITREDLLKYSEHSLSEAIVDRIFQVGTRVFSDGLNSGFKNVGMTFPDFIYFMLAEEDKTQACALQYWFTCCDLDGDGKLTADEMRHFYRLQLHRVTSLGQESINFVDVLCQMIDMIDPKDPNAITLADLTKPDKVHISGTLFDVLFNLHKFMRFESRDPFHEKQKREDMFNCDWDRYVNQEYKRLAQEDEGYEASSMEIDADREAYRASLNDFDDDDEDMYYSRK